MDKILDYSISYPKINHPLRNEKDHIKTNYAFLIQTYSIVFGEAKEITAMRTERFINDFLNSRPQRSECQKEQLTVF